MRIVKVKESGNETVSYTYDANGNKKLETLANGVVSTYTYNKANRITKIENKSGNTDISSYEYSYYLDGSDACKVRSESGIIETTSYEYDGLKRLTEEAVKVGNNTTDTYTYEYDDYGNRSKMTAEGTEDYVTEYSYVDSNGKYTALLQKEVKTVENEADENLINLNPASNIKQTVYAYDANGNQITKTVEGKTETNTYDGLNQLIGFNDGETTASYKYNASGLRYEKTVDGETINHVWDGSKQIVADVVDNQFYEADCYIRGTNLVAKYNYRNGNKSEYTYYTHNAHGDVVNLTNADGEVTKKYTYDAFGVEKNIDDSDTNAFRYCGEYYDTETATVYLRARYYDPSTGRFISRDSYAGKLNDPLSLNLYTYCANNPIYYSDPTGHIAGVDDAIIAGAFIAASIVSLAATTLSQPAVQEGLSTTINKASYFVEDAVENTTSLLASALTTIGCGIAELTGISSAPVLSAPTGLMSEFSTTIDSEANPYLAPWLYASMGSQSIAKDDADAAEKDITFPKVPNIPKTYYHYTNEENAMEILKSGKILPDEKGHVYLTPYLYAPDEVNNALFMGSKSDDYGEYRIAVTIYPGAEYNLSYINPTQPNEIIYYGTIRNGRNANLTVMKNE